jgi:hypothetical protein
LCTKELRRETSAGVKGANCIICAAPVDVARTGCNCPPPKRLRLTHFIRVSYLPGVTPGSVCWLDFMLGDFQVFKDATGCDSSSVERAVHHDMGSGATGNTCLDPTISPFWPRFILQPSGTPYAGPDGTLWLQPVILRHYIVEYSYQGPPPYPHKTITNVTTWSGSVPWCIDQHGTALLTETATFKTTSVTISTDPMG